VSVLTHLLATPHGPARAHVRQLDGVARAALVLGHGAGGGVAAPDLLAAARAAESGGVRVVLVEQPYRVAGRRSPAAATQLDASWLAAVEQLREGELAGLPLVAGGRSSGARVACRTCEAAGATGVLCLAFPLVPPRRSGEAPSRIGELEGVQVPVLVVQGERDPFGMPPEAPRRQVVRVAGDHSLKAGLAGVEAATAEWLAELI
jgi:predicted alpha/beta-hydrolase family hydrolase